MKVQIINNSKRTLKDSQLEEIFIKFKGKAKLDNKFILNRYAQVGRIIKYKDISFEIIDGDGYLKNIKTKKAIYGATISDFEKWCIDKYNLNPIT